MITTAVLLLELHRRQVVACIETLTQIAQADAGTWPKTVVQTCTVHYADLNRAGFDSHFFSVIFSVHPVNTSPAVN